MDTGSAESHPLSGLRNNFAGRYNETVGPTKAPGPQQYPRC